MKRVLVLILVVLSIVLGYSLALNNGTKDEGQAVKSKKVIVRVALVADSHNENYLLEKALLKAKNKDVNFVIGLGDYTNLGTVEELKAAKRVFDASGLEYYVTAGDRDGWDSRNKNIQAGDNEDTVDNFGDIFGLGTQIIEKNGVEFDLLDNSDIYKGISERDWRQFNSALERSVNLRLVFAHKTPFHPDSKHIMGEDSLQVASQATQLLDVFAKNKVDGFFSGDIHFFAQFKDPLGSVRISTIGAIASERNFQGPRFSILNIYDDYSFELEDIEIN